MEGARQGTQNETDVGETDGCWPLNCVVLLLLLLLLMMMMMMTLMLLLLFVSLKNVLQRGSPRSQQPLRSTACFCHTSTQSWIFCHHNCNVFNTLCQDTLQTPQRCSVVSSTQKKTGNAMQLNVSTGPPFMTSWLATSVTF